MSLFDFHLEKTRKFFRMQKNPEKSMFFDIPQKNIF